MDSREKIYTGLNVLFVSLMLLGNLVYQKFVTLDLYVYTFEISVGAILYPLTFFVTCLITEFFGKEKANFSIQIAILLNIVVAMLIAWMDYLPATTWSKMDDGTFHRTFGFFGGAFIGSILACYIAQRVEVKLFLWIKKKSEGKYLWLRSNASTGISLLIDTGFVIGWMALFKIIPFSQVWPLIINSYTWKLSLTLGSTPILYLAANSLRRNLGFSQ